MSTGDLDKDENTQAPRDLVARVVTAEAVAGSGFARAEGQDRGGKWLAAAFGYVVQGNLF